VGFFLPVPLEGKVVVPEPLGLVRSSDSSIGPVSLLPEATSLSPSAGKAAHLAVLVHGVGNPVDARVVADLLVGRVHEDDLKVLKCGILVDPVAVQHAHVRVLAADLLLGNGLQVALELELGNTLVLGLSVHHSLGHLPLAPSAADSAADDRVPLLGLVSEAVGLVGTGGLGAVADLRVLAVLPGTNSEQEPKHVRLLLPPKLLHVFVASHVLKKVCRREVCRREEG